MTKKQPNPSHELALDVIRTAIKEGTLSKTHKAELAELIGAKTRPKVRKNLFSENVKSVGITDQIKAEITSDEIEKFIASVCIPDHPNTKFDENIFINLLAYSEALTIQEKKSIIDKIPFLSQWQIDELLKTFEDLRSKLLKARLIECIEQVMKGKNIKILSLDEVEQELSKSDRKKRTRGK